MKTVNLKTKDNHNLTIELTKHGKIIRKAGVLDDKTIDIIRIFRSGELLGNKGTVVFGTANHEGLFLYLDKENTAVLDAAFEELGCTGEDKELCYRVG